MSDYEKTLRASGARDFEVTAMSGDEERALAALEVALKRGASKPVSYALSLFDDPGWRVDAKRQTNLHARDRSCDDCHGDRFVVVGVRGEKDKDGDVVWEIEEVAACPACNPTDTSHWRYDGTRAQALDPARVRELISRA